MGLRVQKAWISIQPEQSIKSSVVSLEWPLSATTDSRPSMLHIEDAGGHTAWRGKLKESSAALNLKWQALSLCYTTLHPGPQWLIPQCTDPKPQHTSWEIIYRHLTLVIPACIFSLGHILWNFYCPGTTKSIEEKTYLGKRMSEKCAICYLEISMDVRGWHITSTN